MLCLQERQGNEQGEKVQGARWIHDVSSQEIHTERRGALQLPQELKWHIALLYGPGTDDPKEPETVPVSLLRPSPGLGETAKIRRRDAEKFISMC